MVLNQLPLFPLGSVLYPGSVLPLRIFEVRYLDMIRRCIEAGAPFGVVSLTQGNEVAKPGQAETFSQVGTLALIKDHDSPQPGLRIIRCVGLQRFRIQKTERLKHGLWIADVTHSLPDQPTPVPAELQHCATLLQSMIDRMSPDVLHNLIEAAPSAAEFQDCGWLANRWCQLLPLPIELKQRMLELDSPLIRLELVSDLLDKLQLH